MELVALRVGSETLHFAAREGDGHRKQPSAEVLAKLRALAAK
jgi:hypothetical protein